MESVTRPSLRVSPSQWGRSERSAGNAQSCHPILEWRDAELPKQNLLRSCNIRRKHLSCSPPQLATVGEHLLPQEVSRGWPFAKHAREKVNCSRKGYIEGETCSRNLLARKYISGETCSRMATSLAKRAREAKHARERCNYTSPERNQNGAFIKRNLIANEAGHVH